MGIEMTYHKMKLEDFEKLGEKYPTGHYDRSYDSTNHRARWFSVWVEEWEIELTWFLDLRGEEE